MQKKKPVSEKVALKEAVKEVLPPLEINTTKQPRLKTPTLIQAVMLPFFKVPAKVNELGVKEPEPNWNQPHLQQLKHEIIVSSIAMFVCPFAAFFIVQNQQSLIDTYGENKTNGLAALAAVCTV